MQLNKDGVVELKLNKPHELPMEEKINFLMDLVLGSKKIRGIVQAIDGRWEKDKDGKDKCVETGMKAMLDGLLLIVNGGEQYIGDEAKGNKINYDGVVQKTQQLIELNNIREQKFETLEKTILILARMAGLDPIKFAEEFYAKPCIETIEWNKKFKEKLDDFIVEQERKQKDSLEIKEKR